MKILFAEKNGVKRYSGYSKVGYSSNSDSEVVKEASEKELNGLVPDSFEGDWKDNKAYFKLESGEIVFDESYEPETTTGGN